MKRVRIPAYHKGLVNKQGKYIKMLDEGVHWLKPGVSVELYNMAQPFITNMPFNTILTNECLANAFTVVEVKDHEMVLQFDNGLFKAILHPGIFLYWKGVVEYQFTPINLSKIEITEDIDPAILLKTNLVNYIRTYTVEPHETGLLFVNGKYQQSLDAGTYYYWKNAISIEVKKADLRQLQMEISGQEILTRDKATIRVNFYAQYKITDVAKALIDNKDFAQQLYVQMQLVLREHIGGYTLDELLDKKEGISSNMLAAIAAKSHELGVMVNGCGIKDIILPGEVKEIMNQVLIAEKKAQANIIMRREETASTRSLLNTAKLMEENDMLFKLKEMEYVEKIAEKINNISLSGGGQLVEQLKQIFVPVTKVQ
jgi:hypothetical protein